MYAKVEKSNKDTKNQLAASGFSEKQSSRESAFQFVDNRPEAIAQKKIQESASNCSQAKKTAQLHAVINTGPQAQQPIQLLSEIPVHDWKEQLSSRENLSRFPPFLKIVKLAEAWDGISDDENLKKLKSEITELGTALLSNESDVNTIYAAIKKYFPGDYLSKEDVALVKKYNFDGPIAFSAENVMAWLRLANGIGTVDDLRYIHHEIYEIKQIQGTEQEEELVKTKPEESFWEEGYEPAHGAALRVEMSFLAHAITLIYKHPVTWKHVAASDIERREDFIGALYQNDNKEVPLNDEYLPDMEQVERDYGEFIDSKLSEELTALKKKKLP